MKNADRNVEPAADKIDGVHDTSTTQEVSILKVSDNQLFRIDLSLYLEKLQTRVNFAWPATGAQPHY